MRRKDLTHSKFSRREGRDNRGTSSKRHGGGGGGGVGWFLTEVTTVPTLEMGHAGALKKEISKRMKTVKRKKWKGGSSPLNHRKG